MRRWVIFLVFLIGSVYSQDSFVFNEKLVKTDSVFLSNPYAISRYSEEIDSIMAITANEKHKITLLYIKACKLSWDGWYEESTRLLLFCNRYLSSMGELEDLANIRISYRLGINLIELGQMFEGFQYVSKSDSMAEVYNNPDLVLYTKGGYAEMFRSIGKLNEAEDILEEGVTYLGRAGLQSRCFYLLIYASVLNQQAVDKNNTGYAMKANAIIDSILFKPGMGKNLPMYGQLLAEKGASVSILHRYGEAIRYFEQARNIFKNTNSESAFNQDINIFHQYYNLKDYPHLIRLGEDILARFYMFPDIASRQKEIHQRLSEGYEKLGDFRMALHHSHKLIEEKNKYDQITYSRDISELEEKYKAAEKEKQIKLAQLQKDAAHERLIKRSGQLRYTIIALCLFVILLVIVSVLAVQFNFAKRRIVEQSKDLENKNKLLDKTLQEKDFLFNELHHRVKNNLQLITSFMKLQYKYSSALGMEHFIAEMEKKMNAMSLVHERLYKGNNHESIELKAYVEEVADFIIDSFPGNQETPEIYVKGDKVQLVIDTAIPVGLILNELITNAVKHAFKNKTEKPEVFVAIRADKQNLHILVRDNGEGFPEGFDPEKLDSLGAKAVLLLSRQIQARIQWKNDHGAQWELDVPLKTKNK